MPHSDDFVTAGMQEQAVVVGNSEGNGKMWSNNQNDVNWQRPSACDFAAAMATHAELAAITDTENRRIVPGFACHERAWAKQQLKQLTPSASATLPSGREQRQMAAPSLRPGDFAAPSQTQEMITDPKITTYKGSMSAFGEAGICTDKLIALSNDDKSFLKLHHTDAHANGSSNVAMTVTNASVCAERFVALSADDKAALRAARDASRAAAAAYAANTVPVAMATAPLRICGDKASALSKHDRATVRITAVTDPSPSTQPAASADSSPLATKATLTKLSATQLKLAPVVMVIVEETAPVASEEPPYEAAIRRASRRMQSSAAPSSSSNRRPSVTCLPPNSAMSNYVRRLSSSTAPVVTL